MVEAYIKNWNWFLYISIAAFSLFSCKNTSDSITATDDLLYDQSQFVFIPEVVAYHVNNDSTEIIISIPSKDLLFVRSNESSSFQCNVEATMIIKEPTGIKDTLSSQWSQAMPDSRRKKLSFIKKINLGSGSFNAEIIIKDVNRSFAVKKSLRINKTGDFNSQYFKLINATNGEVLTSSYAEQNTTYFIDCGTISNDSAIYLRTLDVEVKLPPAPFSTGRPEIPATTDCSVRSILTYAGVRKVTLDQGLYQLIKSPESKTGHTIFTTLGGFPDVRKIAALHFPLRYLTTKNEFDGIVNAKNPKEKVDQFWIECGGTKDRARELIRSYYTRVEEANIYFSSFTEGWRTDRGMIHLVFGDPSRIVKETYGETWIYGEENAPTSLRFNFQKFENPWSDNVFILNRDQMFRLHWERMVTAWRNGRIFAN